tara:strand:- start:19 stop:336 length:318 start_codon:yes stop_codon:yes gene_type:complete
MTYTNKNISKISRSRKIEASKRFFIMANQKYSESEYQEAYQLIKKSLKLDNASGESYFLSSKIKFSLGEKESACLDIKEGLLLGANQKYYDWLNSPSGYWCKELK